MFRDIIIGKCFIDDWNGASKLVKQSVDRKIHRLALEHEFRPGDNYHKLHGYQGEFWSIYVTHGTAGAWRAIVKVENDKLYLIRLLNHRAMELEYSI